MSKPENEVIDEITLEDIPTAPITKPKNPLDFLPPELRARAAKLPKGKEYTTLELAEEGSGHNDSLLSVAATCFKMGVSYDDTLEHLEAAYSPDRMDYETAPKRAVSRVWGVDGDIARLIDSDADAAPDAKEEMLVRFRRTPSTALVESSPGKLATPAIEIIGRLFKPDDIVNIQRGALEVGTLVVVKDLPAFLEMEVCTLEDFKFLNPATFKQVGGVPNTKHPRQKISTRCNDNVKARDWMVLEYDPDKSKDEKTKLIETERFNTFAMEMAQFAPLVMAIDTGGKSTHFWFDASGIKPAVRRGFFNLACLHGADPRLAVKSQIARMPNTPSAGEGRGPQRLIYFDPDGDKTPEDWDLQGFERYISENKQLEYYYNGENKSFLTRDNLESWVALDRTSLRSHLMQKGFRAIPMDGETITPLEKVINGIQLDKNVEAVLGGASGRHAGLYEENGHRVIVKKSPTFIKPRRGKWPTIEAFLEGLLGHGPDQKEILYGWLSDSARKLRNGGKRRASWGPCQMLHIVGPPNAGKTLLLKDILTPCFASRIASADPIFKKFPDMHNPDTFAAELLFLDDSPVLESGYAFRQDFGERIKSHVVGVGGGMRGMHQGRINMRPWWRFVRLMNMEPATLSTLPPLDEGVEDKLILLRGERMDLGPLGAEMALPGWYERIERRIRDEIAHFLHFLLEEFKVPEHLKDPKQRFPTCSFKNSELMAEIAQGSPESYIMHRIDHEARAVMFNPGACEFDGFDGEEDEIFVGDMLSPWMGTADQLYDVLAQAGTRSSQHRFQKACPTPRILLSQLRNLEKNLPARVGYSKRMADQPDKRNGAEFWAIFPPAESPVSFEETDPEIAELF
tara:strand:+ start:16132 stop:18693 length:2562 start_codon:yes stop_codon:yes gene_type:complete